jgi:hypothetical protein
MPLQRAILVPIPNIDALPIALRGSGGMSAGEKEGPHE